MPSAPVNVMPVGEVKSKTAPLVLNPVIPSAPVKVYAVAPVNVIPSAPVKVMPSAPVRVIPSAPVNEFHLRLSK